MMHENERIDDLELNGLKIIQNKSMFCFGTDAVLLADFVKAGNRARVADLGTGTGILPLLLTAKTKALKITGLEIQEKMCDMARRSVTMNGLEEKVEIIHGDIRSISSVMKAHSYDNVVANPPYMKNNAGFQNRDDSFTIARHEVLCSLEDVIRAGAYLLKFKGSLTMVHRPCRMVDVLFLMRKHGIEPKRLRVVQNRRESQPVLFLVNGVKGANPWLKVEKPLVIKDEEGFYSPEILDIYGKTKE
ncbi:MAG: tRNA1(Val) (adenine(37)-N6)-methyltransferase [Clostridia bacterium]